MTATFATVSRAHIRLVRITLVLAMFVSFGSIMAADVDPKALVLQLPKQIKWVENTAAGSAQAILFGDPSKPGMYGVLTKWHPGHMSRPHFHANDRFITVISGTWWCGTGSKYDPASTVAVPAGSFVKHVGKQIHYDGAKDEEVVLEIVGEGPATSTPAEVK
jgi:hypothetical protein